MYTIEYVFNIGSGSVNNLNNNSSTSSQVIELHNQGWPLQLPSGYTFSKVRVAGRITSLTGTAAVRFGRGYTDDNIYSTTGDFIVDFTDESYDGSTTNGAKRYKYSNSALFALRLWASTKSYITVENLCFFIQFTSLSTPNSDAVFPGEIILPPGSVSSFQTGDLISHNSYFQQHSLITADDWNNSSYGTEYRYARATDGTFYDYSTFT